MKNNSGQIVMKKIYKWLNSHVNYLINCLSKIIMAKILCKNTNGYISIQNSSDQTNVIKYKWSNSH